MRSLVVFDTAHGNTQRIAEAVAEGLGTRPVRVGAAGTGGLEGVELLVIGSPTLGGRASPAMQAFVDAIPAATARRLRVATFDTRLGSRLVGIFGYAAHRMMQTLQRAGCAVTAPPEGFIVGGREGPLADGEIERARSWGKRILDAPPAGTPRGARSSGT